MKKYWIDFSGWGSVYAENEEVAKHAFYAWTKALKDEYGFILAEIDIDGVEADDE